MAVDLIVTPRSCSSGRVSVNRAVPALPAEIIPARWTSESVRVDLPWSTVWCQLHVIAVYDECSPTMGNNRHVTNVDRLVHETADLLDGETASC